MRLHLVMMKLGNPAWLITTLYYFIVAIVDCVDGELDGLVNREMDSGVNW